MDTEHLDRRPNRARWVAGIVVTAVVLAGLWWALAKLHPLPPRVVLMSAGPEGSAYEGFATRYREAFARAGIELRIVPSAGSVENLARLRDPGSAVNIGFVEGGLAGPADGSDLESLGTIFYEPLWVFVRGETPDPKLRDLRGKRLSIGPEGSGTRAFALRLLALNGVDAGFATLLPYRPTDAAEKLLSGEIDAAFILTSWDAPAVRRLASAPNVQIAGFPRADAYVALFPYFSKLLLPMGVGNMAENRPPADVTLIAAKATLVVRKDLHPAIQFLLLDVATQIHGGPGIFHKAAQFPAAEAIDLPLSDDARSFYTSGRPFLQRYLPFWLAVLAGQLLVLLIPVIGVLYPLLRLAPVVYGWSMRRRIFRVYGELKFLEDELERRGTDAADDLRSRLDRLEARANHIRVPVSFRQLQYTLRDHIGLVRQRLG
jgi:TRAP-type uncharacterized transport system substrate-binding protein